MLVLTRKVGEHIVVPKCQLTVTILAAGSGCVRLGVSAPADLVVHRSEVCEKMRAATATDVGDVMNSMRILIADRDEFRLAGYRDHLSQHGAAVATVTTGLACVARLRDFAPDVLVLDAAIPWGGGDGVLAAMQEEPAIRPTAVLLYTHRQDRSLLYRLSSFRVDDFQPKPLNARQLRERICTMRTLLPAIATSRPAVASPPGSPEVTRT